MPNIKEENPIGMAEKQTSPEGGKQGPLQGVKIIDVSSVLMAPFAAQILGDMGADVIKVEPPDGDTIRRIGPMVHPGMGPMYLHANRNKRSITLDLKSKPGKEVLFKLVERTDVLLYNVRPQAMTALGMGYEDLRHFNPGLIYVGAFGFGRDGPYAKRPAFDDLIQGLSGIPSLIAQSAGDGIPRYIPLAMVDRYVGVNTANAILGALLHKARTGQGQSIDVPMFETMAEMVMADHSGGAAFDPPLGPYGYPRLLAPERHPYRTLDGYVCVMIYTDQHWRRFFELIGSNEATENPKFASITTRTINAREIHQMLEDKMRTRSTSDWLDAFYKADIPATRLHTLESLADDPHLKAVSFFEWHEHPSEGRVRMTRPPSRWSETPPTIRRPPPRIGEHSREILNELGYSAEDIRRLAAESVTTLEAPG